MVVVETRDREPVRSALSSHAGKDFAIWRENWEIFSVIARSEATKQSSFLVVAKKAGLLRFARNDGGESAGGLTRPAHPGASCRRRNGRTAPARHGAAVRWPGACRARRARSWSWHAHRPAAWSRSRPRPAPPARHRHAPRPRRDARWRTHPR